MRRTKKKRKAPSKELRQEVARQNKAKWELPFLLDWKARYPELPVPVRDFKFHPTRKWRADFAWEKVKVICELHGGGARGRHATVKGHAADCEKINEAQKLGYMVLQYTVTRLRNMGSVVDEVASAVKNRL